jgi:hypothetical protein
MLDIRRAEDIAPAFEALKGAAQALFVIGVTCGVIGMVANIIRTT